MDSGQNFLGLDASCRHGTSWIVREDDPDLDGLIDQAVDVQALVVHSSKYQIRHLLWTQVHDFVRRSRTVVLRVMASAA